VIPEKQIHSSSYFGPPRPPFLFEAEEMTPLIEVGIDSKVRPTEVDEDGDGHNRVGMQIAQTNFIIIKKLV
jgi:hypothetical protein